MQIDRENLLRYYASLSDEAFLALDRAELTEMAQKCYDEERAQRDLTQREDGGSAEPNGNATPLHQADYEAEAQSAIDAETGATPTWLADAACACTYAAFPGSPAASDAEHARDVLRAAGIPCHISVNEIDPASGDAPPRSEFYVMVPGALNLKATSVLDVEIFNPEVEANWRTHFEALSDDELRALNSEIICAGLLDRMQRLKRAYDEAIARRRLR